MFKDLFVNLLQKRSITAYKLSKDTGLSETLISNWKSGRQLPKYDSLKILCDYFNVSADYLLGRKEDKNMFWERFSELCDDYKTSPNAVCAKIGMSTATAAHWKNGSVPNGNVLIELAKFFQCSVDYLLGYDIMGKEIFVARKNAKRLYEEQDGMRVDYIEEKTHTNYATFRLWLDGQGDFFDDRLYLLADLFDVSVDYLLGRDADYNRPNDIPEFASTKNYIDLYERLKKICRENNITPTVLCTKVTGSPGNLATWKKGNIRTDYLIKIADYFKISVDYLLGRDADDLTNSISEVSTVSGRVKLMCKSKNITVAKMTSDLGLAAGIISNWKKRGNLPSCEVILKISDYFDCSVDYLLGRTDEISVNRGINTSV